MALETFAAAVGEVAEKVGEAVIAAVEKTGEAVEAVAEKAGEAVETTVENAREAVDSFNPDKRIDVGSHNSDMPKKADFNPDERVNVDNKYNNEHNDLQSKGEMYNNGSASDSINTEKKESMSDNPRYIITRNESLENDKHPITGVPFERKIVELPNGEKVEGVFPKFDSLFDAKISEDMYLKSDETQFKECNKQLAKAIEDNPELKKKFSSEQIEQIYEGISDGTAPDGYVWHHDAETGKLQLVDFETHSRTGHTGGRSIWGGGSENR